MDQEIDIEGVVHDPSGAYDVRDHSFGLMRIDGALLAVPVDAIREVIPGHSSYSCMPIKAAGLRGAVSLRGTTIPVLDLRPFTGIGALHGDAHVVVIMRWQGRLMGLVADEVCGIARLPSTDLFMLDYANLSCTEQIATHTFRNGDEVATVLDPQRIAELPNVPMVTEKTLKHQQVASKATESLLLFTCGQSHFGIDATHVDATVPKVRFERNALAGGICLGVFNHHGFEVPAVHTQAALVPSGEPGPVESDVIVLRFSPNAMLGFAIDEVRDISRVSPSTILPMPSGADIGRAPFRGMFADAARREHLLLDMDRVKSDSRFSVLAGLRKPRLGVHDHPSGPASLSAGSAQETGSRLSFLTYMAGGERASLLTQISAIVPYPENIAPFGQRGSGKLGLFTYRNRVVPLLCLTTCLSHSAAVQTDHARVLIVEDGPLMMGFVVEALRSIEAVSWRSPRTPNGAVDRSLFKSIVLVGSGPDRRMLSHVDLHAQIERLNDTCEQKPERLAGTPLNAAARHSAPG